MKTRMIAAVLALAASLGACKEGPAGPDVESGTFEASISGGFTATLSGEAVSGLRQGAYLILMQDTDVQGLPGAIGLFFGTRPAVGSYSVTVSQNAPTGFVGVAATGQSPGQNGLEFTAASGTVVIQESTSTQLRGTFELNGTGYRSATPTNTFDARITGGFTATNAGA